MLEKTQTINHINSDSVFEGTEKFSYYYFIKRLSEGFSLSKQESYQLMNQMMSGEFSDIQLSSILTAYRVNELKYEEISGLSDAMLDKSERIKYRGSLPLIDIVGTGGAHFKSFNVSTSASLILPQLGVAVAKHGNRSNSTHSGAADLLETLGFNLNASTSEIETTLNNLNFTFMFAPNFHPAMRNVISVRKILRFKTIFNILGPLTNPARVKRQLTGVYSPTMLRPIIQSFKDRQFERVAIIHNDLGADEIIQIGETSVYELKDGKISSYTLSSKDFGVQQCKPQDVYNQDPTKSAKLLLEALGGKKTPIYDFISINAAMALRIATDHEDLKSNVQIVQDELDSGNTIDFLKNIVSQSGGDTEIIDKILEGE